MRRGRARARGGGGRGERRSRSMPGSDEICPGLRSPSRRRRARHGRNALPATRPSAATRFASSCVTDGKLDAVPGRRRGPRAQEPGGCAHSRPRSASTDYVHLDLPDMRLDTLAARRAEPRSSRSTLASSRRPVVYMRPPGCEPPTTGRSSTWSLSPRGRLPDQPVRRVLTYAPTSSTEWTPAADELVRAELVRGRDGDTRAQAGGVRVLRDRARDYPHPRSERALRGRTPSSTGRAPDASTPSRSCCSAPSTDWLRRARILVAVAGGPARRHGRGLRADGAPQALAQPGLPHRGREAARAELPLPAGEYSDSVHPPKAGDADRQDRRLELPARADDPRLRPAAEGRPAVHVGRARRRGPRRAGRDVQAAAAPRARPPHDPDAGPDPRRHCAAAGRRRRGEAAVVLAGRRQAERFRTDSRADERAGAGAPVRERAAAAEAAPLRDVGGAALVRGRVPRRALPARRARGRPRGEPLGPANAGVVRIRFVSVRPHVLHAAPGAKVGFRVRSDARRIRWRLGSAGGSSRPGLLVLRAPAAGRYVLRVTANGHTAQGRPDRERLVSSELARAAGPIGAAGLVVLLLAPARCQRLAGPGGVGRGRRRSRRVSRAERTRCAARRRAVAGLVVAVVGAYLSCAGRGCSRWPPSPASPQGFRSRRLDGGESARAPLRRRRGGRARRSRGISCTATRGRGARPRCVPLAAFVAWAGLSLALEQGRASGRDRAPRVLPAVRPARGRALAADWRAVGGARPYAEPARWR